ncbi:MAG: helix-turn-helix transcriptional regulator [Treponema sp.]|nr:helix-turn-helix transcriptional regulator [Treponema sp.]
MFSIAVLINLDFNKLSLATSCVTLLLIIAGLSLIMLTLFQEKSQYHSHQTLQILSKRENEIAKLLLQGKTTQETADALFVSVSTVKTHIQHIYEKTGVRNRAELSQFMQNHTNG